MGNPFSSIQRVNYLKEMSNQELDLLVIGGGITGAGIALDAQVRGIKTGLIEMQDFGAGTSSRSTKLVHGGLRYLKQFEVKLVAEVGKERAIVYENAPHVTTPEWMLLPMIEGGTFGKLATSFGLKVYDFLAGVRKSERRFMLNKQQTMEKEPLLRKDKLKGGGVYVEYKTDDARLTLEIMKEAVARGVLAVNYAKADGFIYENKKIVGVKVVDQFSGEVTEIRAKKIVNAAGPWVDTLREKDNSKKGKYLHLTKGVHLVFDESRFPLKQAVYFDTEKDGRMCFAIPRDGKTYVGTTDTYYKSDITHPRMTVADREYIIDAVNYMFPEVKLKAKDVESCWTGLRPLIHEEGKSASEISRKDEIFFSDSGLISIAGGKLTGYRKMAERIVGIVGKDLGINKPCTTEIIKLSGGDIGGSVNLPKFLEEKTKEGMQLGLTKKEALKLTKLYGTNVNKVYDIIRTKGADAKRYGLTEEVFGALVYGIEEEMVATPVDFFNRRTGAIFFNIDWVRSWKEPVLQYMKQRFNWTAEEVNSHKLRVDQEIEHATVPVDEVVEVERKNAI
ncbi:glycerol-3-phosphate dehydrogenase/oxidase [Anaerobacillus isosaccharinicus]|uniref:Glycerol-3-phosphate dehydrogenase n=1 Tax=Anaerobacillus isosaccharinicus TaxID=1532552 RepID=A0A1S2MDP1_9BACI|nr:glycerol-3-phosphate dehydrogenase/oxidase [Anaerobacillus isosaccharinicus]MBA5585141.1 glycerol-3-phosphate dehydrogenase/oxidase [Anaerobacillus isosaccharinicus]QOY36516.1 glycerol-3-phosphate dehydrogenase/oxidase [Anaerobacillus isosaccharinicus]